MNSTAVQAALTQVIIKLVEGHMETYVTDWVKAGGPEEAPHRLDAAMA